MLPGPQAILDTTTAPERGSCPQSQIRVTRASSNAKYASDSEQHVSSLCYIQQSRHFWCVAVTVKELRPDVVEL